MTEATSEAAVVCRFDDLKPDSAQRIDIAGHRLAVIRLGDDVFVIGDRCSHADYSLADGELDSEAETVECWKHGSTFSIRTGEPTCLPATKAVPTYEVSIVEGEVRVMLP